MGERETKEPQYSIDVIEAARRVGAIFLDGCDRCDIDDLLLLQSAGLMTTKRCTKDDEFGQDSLQSGEKMWLFNAEGDALVAAIHARPTPPEED